METLGHHANDGRRLITNFYGFADDAPRGGEIRRPQFMTQDDYPVPGTFLLLRERAPECGSNAESRKQICRDARARYHPRTLAIHLAEEPDDLVIRCQRFKCVVALSPIKEIGIRAADLVRAGGIRGRNARWKLQCRDRNQALSLWKWQWPQKNAVHKAEDRCGRADPERQGQHD